MFFAVSFWVIFSRHIDSILLSRCAVPQRELFLYFKLAGTIRYFVNVFICPFLDYTPGSYYYWHAGSFKGPHFSMTISSSFYLLILSYYLIDILLSVGTDISIRRHVFILKSLTCICGLLLFIILSV